MTKKILDFAVRKRKSRKKFVFCPPTLQDGKKITAGTGIAN